MPMTRRKTITSLSSSRPFSLLDLSNSKSILLPIPSTFSKMDAHTLELLEFDKVRRILAGYASSALGQALALQVEPTTDLSAIIAEQNLGTDMVWDLELGPARPFGGRRDVRL